MKLEDLVSEDTPDITAMLVYLLGPNNTLACYSGRNLFSIFKPQEFTDPLVPGDIIGVALSDTGVYRLTEKLGHRDDFSPTTLWQNLPFDFGQIGWDESSTFRYSSFQVAPPAYVMADDGDNSRAIVGHRGSSQFGTTLYWGHSLRWAFYDYAGTGPARRFVYATEEPGPAFDVTLSLLSAHFPGDAATVLDTPLTVTVEYAGPDSVDGVSLPGTWSDLLHSGAAGAIRADPADPTPGLRSLTVGRNRSLCLQTDDE